MSHLKTLVLIKLGPFTSGGAGLRVHSPLLEALFLFLFPPEEPNPSLRPIENIWIQDFDVRSISILNYVNPDTFRAFRVGYLTANEEDYERYPHLSHLGETIHLDSFDHTFPHLVMLKHVSCYTQSNIKVQTSFKKIKFIQLWFIESWLSKSLHRSRFLIGARVLRCASSSWIFWCEIPTVVGGSAYSERPRRLCPQRASDASLTLLHSRERGRK